MLLGRVNHFLRLRSGFSRVLRCGDVSETNKYILCRNHN